MSSRPSLHAAALVAASLLTACGEPAPPPAPAEIVGGTEPDEQPEPTQAPVQADSPWSGELMSKAPRDLVATGRPAPETVADRSAPDVVLITIDTWRADRLGVHGSPRAATSKTLAEWAAGGVLFDSAWAPASWTWPTMSSLVTGLYPSAHGAVGPSSGLCDAPATLAEVFHQSGRRTGFAGSNAYFEPPGPAPVDSGFGQGFEFYWARGLEAGPRVIEFASWFLEGIAEDPSFLHLHLFDPHCPYDAPADVIASVAKPRFGHTGGHERVSAAFPAAVRATGACHFLPVVELGLPDREIAEMNPDTDLQAYLDAYDAGLVVTDDLLADIQALLMKHGRWENSWIVVTGDHGEEFGDHGRLGHGKSVYAETSRVPLLIRPPLGADGWARGARVATPVSLVDLAPTLATVTGLPAPTVWQGRDLAPALRGEAIEAAPVLSETDYETTARLIVADGLALHRDLTDGRRLYDLAQDPFMSAPLASESEDTKRLIAPLEARLGDEERRIAKGRMCQGEGRAMTPQQLENLRALGYLGDADPTPTGAP